LPVPPWDRPLPAEHPRDHSRFRTWLQLGSARSFAAAARLCNCSEANIRRLSLQHQWKERAAAYDANLYRLAGPHSRPSEPPATAPPTDPTPDAPEPPQPAAAEPVEHDPEHWPIRTDPELIARQYEAVERFTDELQSLGTGLSSTAETCLTLVRAAISRADPDRVSLRDAASLLAAAGKAAETATMIGGHVRQIPELSSLLGILIESDPELVEESTRRRVRRLAAPDGKPLPPGLHHRDP